MNEKVLVVDDSLTIQKVVSITLASTGYKLTPAHDEDELLNALKSDEYSLILLDFNLSDDSTGFELGQKIKEIAPKSKIMAMVGTFDNVSESELESSGISAHIVKPFESSKFIEMCRELISSNSEVESEVESGLEEVSLEDSIAEEDDDSGWELNTDTSVQLETETPVEINVENDNEDSPSNSLKDEIEGWGITLPDIIEAVEITKDMDSSGGLMPPKIESDDIEFKVSLDENTEEFDVEENDVFSDETEGKEIPDDDLLFPEVGVEKSEGESTSSRLVSLDDLSTHEEQDIDSDEASHDIENIEIDFLDDDEDDDFWAVDGVENIQNEVGPKMEDITPAPAPVIDQEAIIEQIMNELRPTIEKAVEGQIKQIAVQSIEKAIWDLIPDLAENIIKQEVQDLSEKVKSKHQL